MKTLRKGYVSIELVIVAGIVLAFGLYGVSKFVRQGSAAANNQNEALNSVYNDLDALKTSGTGN